MIRDKQIGFLGAGNMAEAIIRGLLEQSGVSPEQLGASDPRQERLNDLKRGSGIHVETDNRKLVEWADVVVLAVKPQAAATVLEEIRNLTTSGVVFVSVAAGLTTRSIEEALGGESRVVRAMPNTPALVRAGATALCRGQHANAADVAIARAIFDAVGISIVLDESQIDAATGLSGSGPAYVFLILEALADAGVKVGLPRGTSLQLAAQTLMGSAKLLLETDGDPSQLRNMVTSPGGTSLAGLQALEEGGLRTTLSSAVEAATQRAIELGKEK
ncbi:MAG: pyrroline-5-carboxylate reductase [Myxococcales bacterium]|nr:pyrroline-5-carboxylate reductase [Myxococcales bacterium]